MPGPNSKGITAPDNADEANTLSMHGELFIESDNNVYRITDEEKSECIPNRVSEWINLGAWLDTQPWSCVDVYDQLDGTHRQGVIIAPCAEGCSPAEGAHQQTYCTVHHRQCMISKYGRCLVCKGTPL